MSVVPLKKENTQARPSFGDILNKTAEAPKTKTTKKEVPVLQTPEEIKGAVDDYLEAKEIKKGAEATMAFTENIIIDYAKGAQDHDGYSGGFRKSYRLPGTSGKVVTFVSTNRWSMSFEDQERLQAILGDFYGDMVSTTFSVKLRDEVFADQALQDELMALVGDKFGKFFATEGKLKASDDFDQRLYTVCEPDHLAELRTFAKQAKPSLR